MHDLYHFEQPTGPKTARTLDIVENEDGSISFHVAHQPQWNVDVTIPRAALFSFFQALAPLAQAVAIETVEAAAASAQTPAQESAPQPEA